MMFLDLCGYLCGAPGARVSFKRVSDWFGLDS